LYLCFLCQGTHDTIVLFKTIARQQLSGEAMFDGNCFSLRFLNRFYLQVLISTAGEKKAIRQLQVLQPKYILDVATGTGDMAVLTQ